MRYRKLKNEMRGAPRESLQQRRSVSHAISATLCTPRRCRIIAAAFFLLMLAIGAVPGEAQALSDTFGDKLLHLVAYSFLTCLLFGGLSGAIAVRAWRTIMAIGLLGGLDEAIQSFMPYRNASTTDLALDMLAATLTIIALVFVTGSGRPVYQVPGHRTARPAEGPH